MALPGWGSRSSGYHYCFIKYTSPNLIAEFLAIELCKNNSTKLLISWASEPPHYCLLDFSCTKNIHYTSATISWSMILKCFAMLQHKKVANRHKCWGKRNISRESWIVLISSNCHKWACLQDTISPVPVIVALINELIPLHLHNWTTNLSWTDNRNMLLILNEN